MSKLAGKVAIVKNGVVVEIKDLGPEPVEVKENVKPLVEQETNTATVENPIREVSLVIQGSQVLRTVIIRDPTPQEMAARHAQTANTIATGDARLKVVADVLWEVARAARTGNWSRFVIADGAGTKPVADKADFIQFVRETAARLG